eukprot:COSAG01_NODE_406_length_17453_cov_83.218105_3_plen_171_part_00
MYVWCSDVVCGSLRKLLLLCGEHERHLLTKEQRRVVIHGARLGQPIGRCEQPVQVCLVPARELRKFRWAPTQIPPIPRRRKQQPCRVGDARVPSICREDDAQMRLRVSGDEGLRARRWNHLGRWCYEPCMQHLGSHAAKRGVPGEIVRQGKGFDGAGHEVGAARILLPRA